MIRDARCGRANGIGVILHVPVHDLRERLQRNFAMTRGAGLCGKTSIETIARRITPLSPGKSALEEAAIPLSLSAKMRAEQTIFADSGRVHAAAPFRSVRSSARPARRHWPPRCGRQADRVGDGSEHASGRDELAGDGEWKVELGNRPEGSGRLCAAAGAAVSAPSSLAMELADQAGTLCGDFCAIARSMCTRIWSA